MSVRFECPACNSVRSVNERALGRELKCPDCGAEVTLPTLEELKAKEENLKSNPTDQTADVEPVDVSPVRIVDAVDVVNAAEVVESSHYTDGGGAQTTRPSDWDDEKALAEATTKFSRPRPEAKDDMDMTPMVDVTFLLLIFFMVTASFSVQKSIQRPAQRKEDPSINTIQDPNDDNPDVVTVQVDEFNAYNVITTGWDRAAGSKQDLIVALNDAHDGNGSDQKPSKLIIEAHEDCIHASVVAALDAGREALFESFEVSTVEQFD